MVPQVVTGAAGAPPPRPTAHELEAARRAAKTHADDPESGVCPHCKVSRCETWRTADAVILRGFAGMTAEPEVE